MTLCRQWCQYQHCTSFHSQVIRENKKKTCFRLALNSASVIPKIFWNNLLPVLSSLISLKCFGYMEGQFPHFWRLVFLLHIISQCNIYSVDIDIVACEMSIPLNLSRLKHSKIFIFQDIGNKVELSWLRLAYCGLV